MDIQLWIKGVSELNKSFDEVINQRNEIFGAMETYLEDLFIEFMDVNPFIKIPLCQDNGRVKYGREIIVEVPLQYDEDLKPQKFSNHLFEIIGWDFSMNKLPSDKHGWVWEITFYPFGVGED